MPFNAPRLVMEPKRLVEIPFNGIVAAGVQSSLVSSRIMYPFRVLMAKMVFTPGTGNLVRHGWYVDGSPGVPLGSEPPGVNIFGRESPTAYFVGDGLVKRVNASVEFPSGREYIKCYTNNGTGAAYLFNCSIVIQEI